MGTDPSNDRVEEEVLEPPRTVPVQREVVRRRYGYGGNPLGGIVGLIVLVLVLLLIFELLGVLNLTTLF